MCFSLLSFLPVIKFYILFIKIFLSSWLVFFFTITFFTLLSSRESCVFEPNIFCLDYIIQIRNDQKSCCTMFFFLKLGIDQGGRIFRVRNPDNICLLKYEIQTPCI